MESGAYLVTYGVVGMGDSWQAQIELWARGTKEKLLNRWIFGHVFERYPDAFAFAEREAKEVVDHPERYTRTKTRGWADSVTG
jgi:hypothetical protein